MVQTALDILGHHDGVIDHQTDGQNEGQQGQQVQGKAQRGQNDEGRKQADRRDDRRNERRPQTAEEDEVHEGHKRQRDADRDPDLVDGVGGEDRIVRADDQLRALGQAGTHVFQHRLDAFGDGEVVGLGLTGDGQTDLVLSIAAEQAAVLGRCLDDAGDVAQPGDIAGLTLDGPRSTAWQGRRAAGLGSCGAARATGADRQLAEVLGAGIGAGDADRIVLLPGLELAGGQFDVLGGQGGFDVADRQATGREGGGVQPDAHGVALLAIDLDLGHAGYGGQAVDQVAIGIVRQLKPVHRRRAQEQDHDRLAVAVRLGHFRRLRLIGQTADDTGHAIAHVVGGVIDVAVQRELDRDVRAAVAA